MRRSTASLSASAGRRHVIGPAVHQQHGHPRAADPHLAGRAGEDPRVRALHQPPQPDM
ncbi:MAG: hypothetical protein ACRDNW_00285 [Trebonia sp.]